jgi:hypothetical protein
VRIAAHHRQATFEVNACFTGYCRVKALRYTPPPLKSLRTFLVVLLLNAAWLAVASYLIARHYGKGAGEPRVEYVTNYVSSLKNRTQPVTVVTNVISATNDFRWTQLESEDYRTYIGRLRTIGCPEQTIRDIIIADIDKLLAPRVQSASLQPRDLKYWEPIEQQTWDDPARRDAMTKQRAVDFEKREVIRELLGVDLIGERLKNQGHDDYYGARLQFLPEEKRARVRLALDQFSERESALMEQQLDDGGPIAAAELQKVQQEKQAAIAQLLTPKEQEQYDLWFSSSALTTRETVYGMNASEEEFLKLYNLRREFDAKYGGPIGAPPDAVQDLNGRIEQALGPERYADYARAQDPEYRTLYSAATRFGLPQKLPTELYGYKQAAAEQSTQVATDPTLTVQQKQAAYAAIQDETERAFKEALGEKAFRYYSKRTHR